MHFGCCTTNPSQLAILANYGYYGVESNFQAIRAMSEEEFEKFRSAVETTGVVMNGMNCFAPHDTRILSWPDEELDDYFESGIRRAKPLGLEYIVIGSGGSRKIPEGMTREEGLRKLVAALRRFGDIAERYDIDIFFEPLRHFETNVINTVTEAAELCKAVNHPRVRMVADFYHMKSVEEPFDHIVSAKEYVRHIHVATADRRVPLTTDRDEVLVMVEQLKAIGYDGRVVLEGSSEPDFEEVVGEFSKLFVLFK